MAAALEFDASLLIVVYLAVEDDGQRMIVVAHRLVSGGGEIDDGEARLAEDGVVEPVESAIVRSALRERSEHRLDFLVIDFVSLFSDYGYDAAHTYSLTHVSGKRFLVSFFGALANHLEGAMTILSLRGFSQAPHQLKLELAIM